jgi:hypothetical protein
VFEDNVNTGYNIPTSPYLSEATGAFFKDLDDFNLKFSMFNEGNLKFSPREWVLNNMTDTVCAEKLMFEISSYNK